jgi:competence ComEA-like helix-hairpin-helix protein
LPILPAPLDDSGKSNAALRLLHEAFLHTLSEASYEWVSPGVVRAQSDDLPFESEIVSAERVSINSAPAFQLEQLPLIGKKGAKNIVVERMEHGPFRSMEELTKRVKGIGNKVAEELVHVLRFDCPSMEWRYRVPEAASFDATFHLVLDLVPRSDPLGELLAVLDLVATTCSGTPHMSSLEMLVREDNAAEHKPVSAQWAGVLQGSQYYKALPDLAGEAQSSIVVCMFHISYPSEKHPTRDLLDALVAAHTRGVAVRVLMDRDRVGDPYQSTIINTPAKTFLQKRGVPCRFDREDRLLHSKYVVLDASTVVIGSHNWSAGSFFHFDDLSVVIYSAAFAAVLTERFDILWGETA